jgi:type IV secretion system protein VirB3
VTPEPVRKSLYRSQLFLGVDRELAMSTILISAVTAAGGYNLIALVAGIVFFVVTMRYLRKWSKMDPMMRDVFLRYIRYVRGDILFSSRTSVYSRPLRWVGKQKKLV